ncbi:MAG: hypothetical protein ABJ360_21905, partial [Roseobacter sp.]
FLNVKGKTPENYRTDLYHQPSLPSPHHPNGHSHPWEVADPTGRNYERRDRRPPEMQEPPYDRYRHQPVSPERIGPQTTLERIPPRDEPLIQLDPPVSQDWNNYSSQQEAPLETLRQSEKLDLSHDHRTPNPSKPWPTATWQPQEGITAQVEWRHDRNVMNRASTVVPAGFHSESKARGIPRRYRLPPVQ